MCDWNAFPIRPHDHNRVETHFYDKRVNRNHNNVIVTTSPSSALHPLNLVSTLHTLNTGFSFFILQWWLMLL